ncbi:MAG: glycosidase related protein [Bryobacterales bacterium]|nr:glycosidase related protein [Bryobacterales bacterium]
MKAAMRSVVLCCVTLAQASGQFSPFERPGGVNPIIKPNPKSSFLCPMRKTLVHWESLHTFNPAAVVRSGKVYVIYRAEDDSGDMVIGHHTSRLVLAECAVGLHFTRRPTPILYPAEVSQK